jgi:hypothetical protein
MPFLVWLLTVWGLTSILTEGRVFRAPRGFFPPQTLLGDFVRCPQCVGFWVGLGASFCHLGVAQAAGVAFPLALVVDGLAASAICAALGTVFDTVKAIARWASTR